MVTINQRIEYLYDRDHTIGHAYFLTLKNKYGEEAFIELDNIFRNKIIPLLQEYFYDDWEKIQIVLGDHYDQLNKNNHSTDNDVTSFDDKLNTIRFIQSQKINEKDIIGFDHDEIEDDSIDYRLNPDYFLPSAYIKIYAPDKELDYSMTKLKKKTQSSSIEFYNKFWPELLNNLTLDDPSQSLPAGGGNGNITIRMPISDAWITVYFEKAKNNIGVFLKVKGSLSQSIYDEFNEEKASIDSELASSAEWSFEDNKLTIHSDKKFADIHGEKYRDNIKSFFSKNINNYVNCFRSRLKKYNSL